MSKTKATNRLLCALLLAGLASSQALAATNDVIARLRAPWQQVKTLSATTTRTTTPTGGKSVKTLSTIYFSRPDKFHAETIAPFHRVTIADGKDLRVYIDGTPKGLLQPIARLSPEMLSSIRAVPGTPENELIPLVGGAITTLAAQAPYAASYSVSNGQATVVLDLDEKGRLARMTATTRANPSKVVFEYSDYREVLPGVWFPLHHQSTAFLNGRKAGIDILRVEDLEVNRKIPASFFNPDAFFPGVTFCADPANAD